MRCTSSLACRLVSAHVTVLLFWLLLCCIRYENSQYEEALHEFPAVGQRVLTNIGSGRVMSLNPLNGYLYIDVEGKGMNKIELKDVTFDREVAKAMKAEENMETELKVLEEDYKEKE